MSLQSSQNKRRRDEEGTEAQGIESADLTSSNLSILDNYLTRFTKKKKNNNENPSNNSAAKITINMKTLSQVDRGAVNLPKEVVLEALYHNEDVLLKFKNNSGKEVYYYKCVAPNCNYTLRITEDRTLLSSLTTTNLISDFKNFTISDHSGKDEGISKLVVFGEHMNHPED